MLRLVVGGGLIGLGCLAACDGSVRDDACRDDADCAATTSACNRSACIQGACGVVPTAAGSPLPSDLQVDDDCSVLVCDGAGQTMSQLDPDDGELCGGCQTASDCPAAPNACQAATCLAGGCAMVNVQAGQPPATQTQVPGDCRILACDGKGEKASYVDDSDVPNDGDPCTSDGCYLGIPHSHPAPGAPCGPDTVCSALGTCETCPTFFGMVTNSLGPAEPGSGVASPWTYGGQIGQDAGDAMCAAIGADHVCDAGEMTWAEVIGELGGVAAGTTFWVERDTTVNGSPPGPGGRCNDWSVGAGMTANGEWAEYVNGAMGVEYHFDSDTVFDGTDAHWEAGLDCSAQRAIPCCFARCQP